MARLINEDDLCKICEHYWDDFTANPDKNYDAHCEVADIKYNFKRLDDVVPYPCLKCPFDSFIRKG